MDCIAHLSALRRYMATTTAVRDGLSRSLSLSQRQQREEYIWGISEIYRRRRKSQVSPIYRPAVVEGADRGGREASSGMRKEAGTEGEELLNYCSPLAVSASGTAIEQTRGRRKKLISGHFVELSIFRSGVISKAEFPGPAPPVQFV